MGNSTTHFADWTELAEKNGASGWDTYAKIITTTNLHVTTQPRNLVIKGVFFYFGSFLEIQII